MNLRETWKKYWQLRWFRNLVFLVVMAIVFFTGLPKWINVQIRQLTLGAPEIETVDSVSDSDNIFRYEMELYSAKGENIRLSSFEGKPLFISFWASWCVPCMAEMPSIMELEKQLGEEVTFLLINSERQLEFEEFIQNQENQAIFYRQLTKAPGPIAHNAIPATYIVDKNGQLVFEKIGASNWSGEETVEKIRKLL